jgi:putative Mg2+ transporter-C (MgtC) family protein
VTPVAQEPLFPLPGGDELLRIGGQLVIAAVLGGALGFERELLHKAAGLRTHMLVALGSALLVIAARHAGMEHADVSRVVQGLITGIGFLGAGAILKSADDQTVRGLTTAATIWLTTAVGAAVGLGVVWLPAAAVVLALVILFALRALEARL